MARSARRPEPRIAAQQTARRRSGGGGSARARRSAERRSAILAAALEEFAARGFAATRLDDVARRAGVAKGTIYLHFADKETLFQELIPTGAEPRGRRAGGISRRLRFRSGRLAPATGRGVRPRDFRNPPQGRDPAGHHRRAALSQARGVLLPRGHCARHGSNARPCCGGRWSAARGPSTKRWYGFRSFLAAPGLGGAGCGAACSIGSGRADAAPC